MEQREAYAAAKTIVAPADCDEPEAVCDQCGWRFGKLARHYRQDGTFTVLYIYGTPPAPTFEWSTNCPACGAPFVFHAQRRGRQARFE